MSSSMNRIFYFNIDFGCNNRCKFCYSHNTYRDGQSHNEILIQNFIAYIKEKNITREDRVILNGGEPLLHKDINEIIYNLLDIGCETLVYTNGRCINALDMSVLSNCFRFVIPIHGGENLHDHFTGIAGSWRETIDGMSALVQNSRALVDLKVIITQEMCNEENFISAINGLSAAAFNNAVHLTMMASTPIALRNRCVAPALTDAATYTKKLFEHFIKQNRIIKVFDTCVYSLPFERFEYLAKPDINPCVFYKDYRLSKLYPLESSRPYCTEGCGFQDYCLSAVNTYQALEFKNGVFYKSLE